METRCLEYGWSTDASKVVDGLSTKYLEGNWARRLKTDSACIGKSERRERKPSLFELGKQPNY